MAGIPDEAVAASVGVLLYSTFSLILCLMLVGLLLNYGEKFTYVTIHSTFTALSTSASIIQQIHYAAVWSFIKQAQYEKAIRALSQPGLTFVGGAHPVDRWLFFIQFWCYNIMALNILFWSIALFTGAWGLRTPWLGDWISRIGPISKIFSIAFPSMIVALMHVDTILQSRSLTFVLTDATMFISLISGSVLLILILFKYMKTRRLAAGGSRRGRWWASQGSKSQGSQDIGSHYTRGTGAISTRSSIYDRALIIRFSIGFIVNAFFLGAIILFSYLASTTNTAIVAAGQPDLRPQGAITDILLFIPGVTASLVTFLVFGTAKSWRQYRDLLAGGCGIRNKIIQRRFIRQQERDDEQGDREDLEFTPLPRLHKTPSLEERIKREEAAKRVRMFTTTTTTITEGEPPRPPPHNAQSIFVREAQRSSASMNVAWDARSLSETTVANDRIESEYSVLPLAPRPALHQKQDSIASEGDSSKTMQFHRPRPSLSRGQVGSSKVPVSAYGTIQVGIEQEDQGVQSERAEINGYRDVRDSASVKGGRFPTTTNSEQGRRNRANSYRPSTAGRS